MRISKPRREMYKRSIKDLIVLHPKVNNIEIAGKIGVHRNTVAKLLAEISIENEAWVNERWKMLLNDVTEIGNSKITQLNRLWLDSYHYRYYSHPEELVKISKMNWSILKDLYRFHLEYMGVREAPKSLVQVNFNK